MPAAGVIVVTRFIVPDDPAEVAVAFQANAARLEIAFSARPGHLRSRLARALDDPTRWVLVSEWEEVGPWRRALSAYDVRIEVMPLMSMAESEPSVYEVTDR